MEQMGIIYCTWTGRRN